MTNSSFQPRFTITNAITAALTQIERARGFLEAATLSEDWIKTMGERAICRDVLAREYGLSERQAKVLGHLLEHDRLTIQEYEALCPGTNRRTLQRDLKNLLDKGLVTERGTSSTDPTKQYLLAREFDRRFTVTSYDRQL